MDKFPEAFERFERDVDCSECKDSDCLIRKFQYWQGREATFKQRLAIRKMAEERRIMIVEPRPMGISKRKGRSREELKRHYTVHKVRGKTRMVARIPKGQKGAGRFAKRE